MNIEQLKQWLENTEQSFIKQKDTNGEYKNAKSGCTISFATSGDLRLRTPNKTTALFSFDLSKTTDIDTNIAKLKKLITDINSLVKTIEDEGFTKQKDTNGEDINGEYKNEKSGCTISFATSGYLNLIIPNKTNALFSFNLSKTTDIATNIAKLKTLITDINSVVKTIEDEGFIKQKDTHGEDINGEYKNEKSGCTISFAITGYLRLRIPHKQEAVFSFNLSKTEDISTKTAELTKIITDINSLIKTIEDGGFIKQKEGEYKNEKSGFTISFATSGYLRLRIPHKQEAVFSFDLSKTKDIAKNIAELKTLINSQTTNPLIPIKSLTSKAAAEESEIEESEIEESEEESAENQKKNQRSKILLYNSLRSGYRIQSKVLKNKIITNFIRMSN